MANRKTGKRGFAAMSVEQRRRLASLGGKAAQAKPDARRWSVEEARQAGRVGGRISGAKMAKQLKVEKAKAGEGDE